MRCNLSITSQPENITHDTMPGVPSIPVRSPFNETLGETIPSNTPHGVSVSLPTWDANVGYEEGQDWVISKMQTGYPRFFIHKSIDHLAGCIVSNYGSPSEKAMLFPSHRCAARCLDFFKHQNPGVDMSHIQVIDFLPHQETTTADGQRVLPKLSAVVYPKDLWPTAKTFWQHTGEGISSRRAEFCQKAFDDGSMVDKSALVDVPRMCKGPKRYRRNLSQDLDPQTNGTERANSLRNGLQDPHQFVEERFGRNLNADSASQAKLAIRRRIAGSLTTEDELPNSLEKPADFETERSVHGFAVDDVYLFPCGMNAIFTAHRIIRVARGEHKAIMFGFPYVDTLKVLEKFGPGCLFYGHGSDKDLDDLKRRLEAGERYVALFCEFPGNPLLKTPDLLRIRKLSEKYDFAVVVDETIGNFLNINVLPHASIVVSSLTKIFSGDSNVMGGSMILDPRSRYYAILKKALETEYEDNYFEEDSVFMERNSRDFVSRIERVNVNAEAICEVLMNNPKVKQVNYPKCSPTRKNYDACKLPNGGYGGLLSATFHSIADAALFYDNLDTQKGPSLGTNFTLSSPFVILAHYQELDWAAKYGCEASLIRFSVGLEDTETLKAVFERALAAIPLAQ